MGIRDIDNKTEQHRDNSNCTNQEPATPARLLRCIVDTLYLPPLRRFISIEVWRWGICGVANYIVLDSLIYFILYHYIVAERYVDLGIVVISPHILSLIILFPITFMSGFWLNRNVAFRATQQLARNQLWRYAITIIGSIMLNYIAMKVLIERFDLWPTPSKVATSILTSTYSYLMARYFTFRSSGRE